MTLHLDGIAEVAALNLPSPDFALEQVALTDEIGDEAVLRKSTVFRRTASSPISSVSATCSRAKSGLGKLSAATSAMPSRCNVMRSPWQALIYASSKLHGARQ